MNKRVCCFVVFALMSELVVSSVWSQENQIINSEFDEDLNAWGSYGAAGFTIEVVRDAGLSGKNGALLDVTDASAGGAIGLAQSGLLLEPGATYPIGFTARAEQDREMVLLLQTNLNSVSWPTQVNQKMNLTTKPQEYFFEYTHTGNTNCKRYRWTCQRPVIGRVGTGFATPPGCSGRCCPPGSDHRPTPKKQPRHQTG